MSERIPFVVIGAGAMGLATTWQLARGGHRVIAFEQFERGHTRGASHGATRNISVAAEAHATRGRSIRVARQQSACLHAWSGLACVPLLG